jgi:thiosulfate/3-mercaptopyruvate sulfurtransferase
MSAVRAIRFVFAFLLTAFVVSCATSARADSHRLVTPAWLEQHQSSVLVLDASMPHQHAAGHIPGAVSATVFGIAGVDHPPAEMERRIRAWGVSPGRKIVVVDEGGSWMATRLFFDLMVHGVPLEDLHLLDGGLHQWKAAGKPVSKEPTPRPAEGSFRVTQVRDEMRVRLNEFFAATGDTAGHVVFDALEPPYYFGGAKFFERGGHIPNAKLWPSSDFFNADKTFKSPEEIRRMLAHHGVTPAQTVHVYCGGGGAASVPVFALRVLLGRDKVKLYNASQREWIGDERGLPLATHPAAHLLRRASWLDAGSAPMLRMAGLVQLSVLDVRSAEAHAQGHAPYSLNVPAAVFRSHLHQPEKLAELLRQAGVNPRHEAVISTDRGLTPDVALAWWMLERLGQAKVSLLAASVDDWALAGYSLTKQPTTVGAAKSAQDLAVPLVSEAYRAVAAPAQATGVYPTVYIATGATAPPRLPAGAPADAKLVHLPYGDLLNPQGLPKPANELWNLLHKAGVPRYAKHVVIANDVGQAAMGYWVLKLMGLGGVQLEASP